MRDGTVTGRVTKEASMACVRALALCVVLVAAAHGEAPEPAPPPKDAAAEAAAKKKAQDARYDGISKKHRAAVLFIDEANPKLMQAWFAIRDVAREQVELDQVWGNADRKKAERRKVGLEAELPPLKKTFKELRDAYEPDIARKLDKARRAAARLAKQTPSGNEEQQMERDEECARLHAEIVQHEAVLSALRSMGTFSASRYKYSVDDRLATLGIDRNDYAVRKNVEQYENTLDAVFTVRDRIAEVEELEALKAAGEGWSRRHEFSLTRATAAMETAGKRLEQAAVKDQAPALREIATLKSRIEELNTRIEKLPQGSPSQERLFKQKWELELELVPHENHVDTLQKLADWKKLRSATPAPKKQE